MQPYKEALDRWLWPDVLRNEDASVVKAKQAISSYKKAVGDPIGLAELMVFYCECAAAFCNDKVRFISHNFGYGVGDDMDSLLGRVQHKLVGDPRSRARSRRSR